MSGIKKKFLFQALYAFSQLAFPLITYPYITRKLNAAGLGLVGYVDYISGFVMTVAAFGIPLYGVREIARLQNELQKKEAVLRQLFSFHFLLSLLGCAVFVFLIKANHRQNIPPSLLTLGCANILLPAFVAEWYMQGIEAFVFTTLRSIVLRFFGIVALLLFVNNQGDYSVYYLITVLVQAAVAFTNVFKIGPQRFRPDFSFQNLPLKKLWHFFLTSSLVSVYVFFDVIILGWTAGNAHVGYYTIAIKIVKLSLLMVLSLNVILFPRISFLKAAAGEEELIAGLIEKSTSFIFLLTVPLLVGFYFLAAPIVQVLAGPKFASSITVVQWLCGLPLIIGLSNLFSYQILLPFGQEKKLLWSVAITCVCSLALQYFLSSRWAENGTAIATLLTEFLMMALVMFFSLRTFRFHFPVTALWQSIVATLPFLAIVLAFRTSLTEPFYVLLFSIAAGGILYLLIQLFVFKNALLANVWNGLKQGRWRTVNG